MSARRKKKRRGSGFRDNHSPTSAGAAQRKSRTLLIIIAAGVLMKGERYVLYQYSYTNLFLQRVDERTGAKIGEKIRITGNVSQAAIDPLGHFVIYTTGSYNSPLLFQALDALGQPSGSPRIIATGVGWGLDILKD